MSLILYGPDRRALFRGEEDGSTSLARSGRDQIMGGGAFPKAGESKRRRRGPVFLRIHSTRGFKADMQTNPRHWGWVRGRGRREGKGRRKIGTAL